MSNQDSSKDLDGLLVVTVEQAVAAPYTSCRLADAGARVIKVERPEGDFARNYDNNALGNSAYFVWLNRGKESVSLDLKNEKDFMLFKSIISKADILIQNLAPGAFERLGLDLKELRDQYPRLITCSISGFGDDGPYKNQKAYDMLIQAETGVIDITGHPDKDGFDGRAKVGPSVCDISAGMTAYQAILQALIKRGVSGKGRHISVSMFNSLADWMNPFYLGYVYNEKTFKKYRVTDMSVKKENTLNRFIYEENNKILTDKIGYPQFYTQLLFEKDNPKIMIKTVINNEEGISVMSNCKKIERFEKES